MVGWTWGIGLVVLAAGAAVADTVTLANGDTLEGTVIEESDRGITLEHPQLGRIALRPDQMRPPEAPRGGLFGTPLLVGWSRQIDVGVNGQEGNAESKSLTLGLRFDFDDASTRWDVDGRYFFNENRDARDDNNARFFMRRDWLFPNSRWFGALGERYQFDRFESWKHRLTVFGGPGYRVVRSAGHQLDLILAPAFTKEFEGDADDKAEAVVNLNYRWEVAEHHTLTLGNSVFTELVPDEGGVRNNAIANWSVRITEDPGLSLSVGLESEYETRPEEGDRKHDLKYFLSLGLDL